MGNQAEWKKQAAEQAVDFVESGMVVGLGTGSTAQFATEKIGKLCKQGNLKNILGVPSSLATEELAKALGIPLATFEDVQVIDITIDGADEVDKDLNLIKGGGGALLQEKILAQASKRNIIVVDETKVSEKLGEKFFLPVEVVPFAEHTAKRFLESLGAEVSLRTNVLYKAFRSDHGNLIVDARFGPIDDPVELAKKISSHAGIVEHGLFLGLTTDVIVAGEEGIRHLTR